MVGYVARAPRRLGAAGLPGRAARRRPARALYDDDAADLGYVMNDSQLWAHLPDGHDALFDLLGDMVTSRGLSVPRARRPRGRLRVCLGDTYCSLAWGNKLAEKPIADWPRRSAGRRRAGSTTGSGPWPAGHAGSPATRTAPRNRTSRRSRAAGYDDGQVFAITGFVALRLAFSTVNDALGACPDAELAASAPAEVRRSVGFGREPVSSG